MQQKGKKAGKYANNVQSCNRSTHIDKEDLNDSKLIGGMPCQQGIPEDPSLKPLIPSPNEDLVKPRRGILKPSVHKCGLVKPLVRRSILKPSVHKDGPVKPSVILTDQVKPPVIQTDLVKPSVIEDDLKKPQISQDSTDLVQSLVINEAVCDLVERLVNDAPAMVDPVDSPVNDNHSNLEKPRTQEAEEKDVAVFSAHLQQEPYPDAQNVPETEQNTISIDLEADVCNTRSNAKEPTLSDTEKYTDPVEPVVEGNNRMSRDGEITAPTAAGNEDHGVALFCEGGGKTECDDVFLDLDQQSLLVKGHSYCLEAGKLWSDGVEAVYPSAAYEEWSATSCVSQDAVRKVICSSNSDQSSIIMDVIKEEKPHACTLCTKKYKCSSHLKVHMRTHTGEKPYKCLECDKAFGQTSALNQHKRIHTGEKPYKCDECDRTFVQKSALKIHKRRHTGEKPYLCTICARAFSMSSNLDAHIRIHLGERHHKCTVCEKAFVESTTLALHMRTHTGEKPYMCSKCGKAFNRSSTLAQHMRMHSGVKPCKCTECGKAFKDKSHLARHTRIHTGERPYKCTVCERAFKQSSHLVHHSCKPVKQLVSRIKKEDTLSSTASVSDGILIGANSDKALDEFLSFCLKNNHEDKQRENKWTQQQTKRQLQEKEQLHQNNQQHKSHSRQPRKPNIDTKYKRSQVQMPESSTSNNQVIKTEPEDQGDFQMIDPLSGVSESTKPSKSHSTTDNTTQNVNSDSGDETDIMSEYEYSSKMENEGVVSDTEPAEGLYSDSDLSALLSTTTGSAGTDTSLGTASHTVPLLDSEGTVCDTVPAEELSLDSDWSALQAIHDSPVAGNSSQTAGASTGIDPIVTVKVEAITDSETEIKMKMIPRSPDPAMGSDGDLACDKQGGTKYDTTGTGNETTGSSVSQAVFPGRGKRALNTARKSICSSNLIQNSTKLVLDSGEKPVKPFMCTVCFKTFKGSYYLKLHMRTHTGDKPFKCSECDKAFILSAALIQHKRTHTGEKPYTCDECNRTFTQKSALTQHKRVHTGEKPYLCTICAKSFNLSSNLNAHIKIHTGEKPYKCEKCGKGFISSSTLALHTRTHTGEKPYMCSLCGKAFNRSSTLTRHMMMHSGIKPSKCSECGKCFKDKSHLARHARIHTGERPYKCAVCERAFKQSSHLVHHSCKPAK